MDNCNVSGKAGEDQHYSAAFQVCYTIRWTPKTLLPNSSYC